LNILITGRNGFIGKELTDFFSDTRHRVLATCRKTLDVTNEFQVDNFFKDNQIDVVLHAAIKGGRRTGIPGRDTYYDFMDNLNMFKNLFKHKDKYKLMISFGSGAETQTNTYYGLAKNIINKEIEKSDNIINLRLYGCFGPSEDRTRFIKNSFNRLSKNKPILIHQDKYMDYLYIEDLKKVVLHYIENYSRTELPKTLDLCYIEKVTLFEIANKIKNLTNSNVEVIINYDGCGISYVGSGSDLSALKLDLYGLQKGIKRTLKDLIRFKQSNC